MANKIFFLCIISTILLSCSDDITSEIDKPNKDTCNGSVSCELENLFGQGKKSEEYRSTKIFNSPNNIYISQFIDNDDIISYGLWQWDEKGNPVLFKKNIRNLFPLSKEFKFDYYPQEEIKEKAYLKNGEVLEVEDELIIANHYISKENGFHGVFSIYNLDRDYKMGDFPYFAMSTKKITKGVDGGYLLPLRALTTINMYAVKNIYITAERAEMIGITDFTVTRGVACRIFSKNMYTS